MKYIKIQLIAMALLTALPGDLWSQEMPVYFPEEMVVSANALNLREKPDKQSAKMATLKRGEVVQVLEVHNNGEYVEVDSIWASWYKVRYQGKTGYAFGAHLNGTSDLRYEGEFVSENLPPLQWYGVYERDSFSDEVRKIELRLKEEYNEFQGGMVKVLKTNQKEPSKFIFGTLKPIKTGFAGPLGSFEIDDYLASGDLGPGAMISIYPGSEANDTTMKAAYTLAATGCAKLDEMMVKVMDYRLLLINYAAQPPAMQDMTEWFKTLIPDANPNVSLSWYGDLDHDDKPDVIINDCPYETGYRASLFLSSAAKPGAFLKKVCEYTWEVD